MKKLFLMFAFITFYACTKENCQTVYPYYAFTNYDNAALSIFIIKTYDTSSNFSQILQTKVSGTTIQFSRGDTIRYSLSGDTDYVNIFQLEFGKDYLIEIPATNQIFKITKLSYSKDSRIYWFSFGENPNCSNTINYNLDGVPKVIKSYDMDGTSGGAQTKILLSR